MRVIGRRAIATQYFYMPKPVTDDVCVSVLGFYITFNNLSVISPCLDVDRKLNAHPNSASSLNYQFIMHTPDTWNDTPPPHKKWYYCSYLPDRARTGQPGVRIMWLDEVSCPNEVLYIPVRIFPSCLYTSNEGYSMEQQNFSGITGRTYPVDK